MSLTPGATLGPYTIRAELGHGGMGVVYTAQDPRLKRQVAIKLLTADLTRDETAKQRFLQEAQAASALDLSAAVRRQLGGSGRYRSRQADARRVQRTKFRALGGSRVYKGAIRGKQIGNPGQDRGTAAA